jgi:MYXO-CTERM domain-containing protein
MTRTGLRRVLGDRFLGLKVALFGGALAAASLAAVTARAEPAECLSFDPTKWPAPSKPYFMIAFDTSSSMTDPVNNAAGQPITDSCGYGTNRISHGRCAIKNTFLAFAGQVNFGLAHFAKTLKNCSATCFTGCNATDFPLNVGLAGCGPLPATCGSPAANQPNAGCRQGANIEVPMLVDNFYSPPPNPSNISELLKWVDNDCSDNKELFPIGNTPLNGILRDMYRYYSSGWTSPVAGGNSWPSPLADLAQGERACRSLNVILVTDGDETCDSDPADPIDAAADLYAGFTKGGITWNVRTHVIGFGGLSSGSLTKINSIAAAGGTTKGVSASNETELSAALANILGSAIKPESCDNTDNNCNGCTDEGFVHYCDVSQTCCTWSTAAQRATCLTNYQATITAANPSGDLTKLPCTTAAQQQDPTSWLCYNPGDKCDNVDNNCSSGVDENATKCGSPAHCPQAETCNGLDDDCDGVADNGGVCNGCKPSPEICDGCDNDCDGFADNGVAAVPCGLPSPANCAGTIACKPPVNVPVGTCTPSGGYGTCSNSPQTETCDGIDNDCDGTIDDNVPPTACVPAGTPGGLVYGGTSQCKKGSLPCNGTCQGFVGPSPEICDGIDNDCDGVVDDSPFGVGTPCGVNQPPCKTGLTACVNGALVCQGGTLPQPEVCDGVDNNCNGSIDEAPLADAPAPGQNDCWNNPGNCCTFGNLKWCPPPGATCSGNGTLSSPCNAGKLVCNGAQKWVCATPNPPKPEACDGIDNDCNGMVDDGNIQQVGQPCGSDVGECVAGALACNTGVLTCVGDVGPTAEKCNGKDDDCDGQIDNGVAAGGTCTAPYDTNMFPGPRDNAPCMPGILTCDGSGNAFCDGAVAPTAELCDGIDNDCDGKIDEAGPAPDGIEGSPSPNDPNKKIGDPCGVSQGACTPGKYACVNGVFTCLGGQQPSEESCDCSDNDCDGQTDESDPNSPICSAGKKCVNAGGSCACAAPCGSGEFPCPPGQKCEQVTDSNSGQPLSFYCVPDNCGDCSKKTIKDKSGNVICAPAGAPADNNCVAPPVCVCKGQAGCKNPCDGVTCPSGQVCTDYGPNAGKCVVDNCYNVPCVGCNKVCHLGSCVDNPCKADSCPAGQVCKPSGDFTTSTCVGSCQGKSCGANEVCQDGTCVPGCNPACDAGKYCDLSQSPPTCVDDKCTAGACAGGGCCNPLTGACGDCPCEGVLCPTGQTCADGNCSGPSSSSSSSGAGGAGGGSTTSSSSSGNGGAGGTNEDKGVYGLATGGGGCACEAGPGASRSSAGALALLGLSLIAFRRRRAAGRKEVVR